MTPAEKQFDPNHFDEMTCLLYLEGQLDRPRALELSAHADSCDDCRALLRVLELESKRLTQALLEENESVPARLLSPPVRQHTPWGWIVTLGLAGAGAYTVWTAIDSVQQQLGQAGFGQSNLFTMLLFSGAFWKGWGSMANFIEILASASLGILAIGLLHRSWRRRTTLALVLTALVLGFALPQGASAAEVKKLQSYTLEKGETIHNDLILMGASARIDGTVDGDLISFGQRIVVNGHVTGDFIVFGQHVTINGQVDGNIRGFCNTLDLKGSVGKNLTGFSQNLDLDAASRIGGGVMAFTNEGSLEGHIGRDLMGFGQSFMLNGVIGGNVKIHGDRLSINSAAEIDGKAKFTGRRQPEVDSHAKLASPLEIVIETHKPDYSRPRYWFHQLLAWGAAFLFGLVIILLAPQFFGHVVGASREYLYSILLGLGTLLGVPVLAVIACITLVGLGIGISSILLWLVAIYSAQTFVSVWLGQLILKPADAVDPAVSATAAGVSTPGAMIGRLALGLLILRVVFLVPYIGGWLKFAVLLWGLGALALALFRKRSLTPLAV